MTSPDVAGPTSARVLGLPVDSPRTAWVTTLVVFVVLAATMQRDLGLFDSAELALVGVEGGLGHPTGQPLHTLLCHLATHVPGLPALWGANLLSALPAALCVVPIFSLARHFAPRGAALGPAAAALIGATLLHPSAWEPATRVEVYALAAFFALWAVARVQAAVEGVEARALGTAGLALGLSASANPFMAVAAALASVPALLLGARAGLPRWPALWRLCVGGLAGLLPYTYVFLVAHRTDAFVWEGDALDRFFSGADYAHNRGLSFAAVATHAAAWARASFAEGHLPVLLLGTLAGLRGRRGAWGLLPISGLLCVYVLCINRIFYTDNPDYLGYLLLPTGCAAAALAGRAAARPALGRALAALGLGALFLLPPGLLDRTRHRDATARALAEPLLLTAPPRAILLVESDHFVFPLLYLQRAEGLRPDVVVLVDGLLDATWFWRLTYAWHPELVPIELPGTHAERVGRFFAAHRDREVLAERGRLAASLGRPVCMGPRMLQTTCGPDAEQAIAAETATLDALWTPVGDGTGAPMVANVLAAVGLDRGEHLWRQGRPAEALAALMAGVPPGVRPAWGPRPAPRAIPPLRGPLPEWRRAVMLGEAGRNLVVAARLLDAGGDRIGAMACIDAAAALGLPEALDAMEVPGG